MFCKTCGKTLVEDSVFCPYCGNVLVGENSIDDKTNFEDVLFDDDYYKKKANNTASDKLVSFSKWMCFISLICFLIFNIKMAPSYGGFKFLLYVVFAVVSIVVAMWMGLFILEKKNKAIHILSSILFVLVIISCIGLRIVYESKIDSVINKMPKSNRVLVSLSTKTDYYNRTGFGFISDPFTDVSVGKKSDEWKELGDKYSFVLNQEYPLLIETGGRGYDGNTEGTICFDEYFVSNGIYRLDKTIELSHDVTAKVQLTFKRHCTFWEVIFY